MKCQICDSDIKVVHLKDEKINILICLECLSKAMADEFEPVKEVKSV